MKKLAATLVLGLVIGAIGVFAFLQTNLFGFAADSSSKTGLIQEQIVELSEWTTLKYEYRYTIVSRTGENKNIPFTDINFVEAIKLIEYTGYLKAGSDLSGLEIKTDDGEEKISLRIPKAKILDNVVDTEKTTVEDIKGNIFSNYPTQTVFDEVNKNKKQIEEEKIDQGLLDEADQRTEELLTDFLNAQGYSEVAIEFY